jgi:hypothetical protein
MIFLENKLWLLQRYLSNWFMQIQVCFNFGVQMLAMVHNICIDYGQCDYKANQIIHLNQPRHMVQHKGLLRLR